MTEQGKTEEEALEVLRARSRDNGRTPMQWTGEDYAGFSSCKPWISIPDNAHKINALAQRNDPDSVYSFYRKLICLHKERSVIAHGRIEFLFREHPGVLAYRRYNDQEELYAFHNLTEKEIKLPMEDQTGEYKILLGNYDSPLMRRGSITLRPYETAAFEIADR